MRNFFILFILTIFLSSCAGMNMPSMNDAGRVGFKVTETKAGFELKWDSGKEFTGLDVTMSKDKEGTLSMSLKADKVGAFKGQEIAAGNSKAQSESLKAIAEMGKAIAETAIVP